MSAPVAVLKAEALHRADVALDGQGASLRRWSAWVPGRIEIFGKHTDYAGGRSLLCAVERGFVVRIALRTDRVVRAVDVASQLSHTVEIGPANPAEPRASWALYIDAVVRRVARNFPGVAHGIDLAFSSDLPIAAGMSSSSALIIATFMALAEANELRAHREYRRAIHTPEDLASYLGCVENGQAFRTLDGETGAGTFGGSEDHVAILCSAAGQAMQYAFAPVRRENAYRFPQDHRFVVASSGVAAEKTGNARERYNRLSLMVRHLLIDWNRSTGRADDSLAAAVQSSAAAPSRLRDIAERGGTSDFDGASLVRRLDQFLLESLELVPAAGPALSMGDWTALGGLAERSQRAAEEWLGNQVPETEALTSSARELGARAASAFGAGFGGSVWAWVPTSDADEFTARWRKRYAEEFPSTAKRAEFFVTQAGPAAYLFGEGR
jgi:galactokinase